MSHSSTHQDIGKPVNSTTGVAKFALSLQTTATNIGSTFPHLATGKRGLKHGLKGRKRTVCLFIDSTIFNEIPPLRAMWAPIGAQAEVPILGQHRAKRILTGVLNIQSGSYFQYSSEAYNQDTFQLILKLIRRRWRGWHITLFLDKISAQSALRSRRLAHDLGIQLRYLPTACPELNPVDHLWRHLKKDILANEPLPDLKTTLKHACAYLEDLSSRQRLRKAGVLSGHFWLQDVFPPKI
ncbi:MAG: transposase [Nitrososphaera sp.]|nr:transposase [Nitrososphaera sp.]